MAWLASLLLAAGAIPHAAHAAPAAQSYTYAECSRADAAVLEAELTTLAQGILLEGSQSLDLAALVNRTWRDVDADAALDAAVASAVAQVRADEGYWQRLWSGWSADKAGELADKVAGLTFADPGWQATLDELVAAIAAGLVVELDAHMARAASSTLLCLQDYVGEQYSATLFAAFQTQVSQGVAAAPALNDVADVAISPLSLHTKGLTGVGVIVATQVTRRIAQGLAQQITGRLAGKIAGRVLGRLGSTIVPYVGWVVGIGLLAWDLWDGNDGALPTIQEAFQTEEVKAEVRAEVTAAVQEGLSGELTALAGTLAGNLLTTWQGFCTDHGVICEVAAAQPPLRARLNATPISDLPRLVQVVDFYWSELGEAQLTAALNDGTLAALLALPPAADAILAWTGSPPQTLAWAEAAGEQLPVVIASGLYQQVDPLALPTLPLAALLTIGDNAAIHRLAQIPVDALLPLLQLPTQVVQQLAAAESVESLTWLGRHLATLPAEKAASVAAAVVGGATTVAQLQTPPVAAPVTVPVTVTAPVTVGAPVAVAAPDSPPVDWEQRLDNSLLIAAGLLVLLLLAAGLAAALRPDPTRWAE